MTVTVETMTGDHPCPTCQGTGRVRYALSISDRERTILRARYGDDGQILKTYKQMSVMFGISAGRVQQIVANAESKIRLAEDHLYKRVVV